MLTQAEVMDFFRQAGAVLEGHFKYTSGKHGRVYMEKMLVMQYPEYTGRMCAEFARRFADSGAQVVVGPATGGILLSHMTAKELGLRGIFTERENGTMALRRGFQITPGEKVLVVEDVVTTGGSVLEVLELVKALGGEVVGLGLLVDRSNGKVDFGVRTEALLTLDLEAFAPETCPQCLAGEELTQRGSRGIGK